MKVFSRSTMMSALLLVAPLVLSAQAAPKAEELFARHVAAIGGKEAILKINSVTTKGTLSLPAMGMNAAYESMMAAPNRNSIKMTMPGLGEFANGFDGTVAWEVNPMQGARVKSGKELQTAKDDADFYGSILFSMDRYSSVETVGQVDFGGEKAWQVKTVLKSGRVVNQFFSVATGLKIGYSTTQESAAGTADVVTIDSDYKQFGAIKMATKSEITTGPQKFTVTLSDILFTELPPSAFALPEPIKALIKP